MEVALDDYIKTKNIKRSGRGRGANKPGRGASRGTKRIAGVSRGINKKASGRSLNTGSRNVSRMALGGGDRWEHDLYGAAAGARGLRSGGGGGGAGAKLLISNLDFGVSDSDINDLFVEFGPLKKASVHYDRSGRSIGTAEVMFIRAADAMSAMRKYNGVPLDGRAMTIEVVPAAGAGPAPVAQVRQPRVVRGGRTGLAGRARSARGVRGGRGGARGGRGGAARRGAKPDVTQEQLDMELDEYQASAVTTA